MCHPERSCTWAMMTCKIPLRQLQSSDRNVFHLLMPMLLYLHHPHAQLSRLCGECVSLLCRVFVSHQQQLCCTWAMMNCKIPLRQLQSNDRNVFHLLTPMLLHLHHPNAEIRRKWDRLQATLVTCLELAEGRIMHVPKVLHLREERQPLSYCICIRQ